MSRRAEIHRHIYAASLALMAIALPLSMFLMSLSSIILVLNWLFSAPLKTHFERFKNNEGALVFSSLFLMHLLSFLYGGDVSFTLNDLRIKLPLIVYPLVLGSSLPLSLKAYRLILILFVSSTLLACVLALSSSMGLSWKSISDFRSYSPFISHIRFSLLISVAALYLFQSAIKSRKILLWALCFLGIALCLSTLNILQSVTGFAILAVIALIELTLFLAKKSKRWLYLPLTILLCISALGAYLYWLIPPKEAINFGKLPSHTANGNPYTHLKNRAYTENGHPIFINMAYDEMERAWYQRSQHNLSDTLPNGADIHACLTRYLSSKGLAKDSLGVWSLTEQDIKNIESGITNYLLPEGGLQARLITLHREYENYLNKNYDGSSVVQRIIYFKTAWRILHQHFWLGVGSGNLQKAYQDQYTLDKSPLSENYRLRAHNQYLSIWLCFGIFGLLLFGITLLYPVHHAGGFSDFFTRSFLFCALLSFLSEDTLETQAGVSFFIFFFGLTLWAKPRQRL